MIENKENIFDYLIWRGDIKIENSPINRIDVGIFSQMPLLDLENIVPKYKDDNHITIKDAKELYLSKDSNKSMRIGLIIPNTIISMFIKMSKSERYMDLELSDYIDHINLEKEEQFCALTVKIDENTYCICFSGTDDSIVGWKENLNMMFDKPIAAQLNALKYTKYIMQKHSNANFYICGHSKGGNLALYSCLNIDMELKEKIKSVYNFDGPGLNERLAKELKDDIIYDKVLTVIPNSSTIGRLFTHTEKTVIVKSFQVGFYQHDIFSWCVLGRDFIYEKELSEESIAVDENIKIILMEMTDFEKEKFANNLYTILSNTEAMDLLSLSEKKKKLIECYFKLPREERKYVFNPLKKLLSDRSIKKVLFSSIRAFSDVAKENNKTNKEIQNEIDERANSLLD